MLFLCACCALLMHQLTSVVLRLSQSCVLTDAPLKLAALCSAHATPSVYQPTAYAHHHLWSSAHL